MEGSNPGRVMRNRRNPSPGGVGRWGMGVKISTKKHKQKVSRRNSGIIRRE